MRKLHDEGYRVSETNAILDRLKRAYGLDSDADLARFLEVDERARIPTWRRRGTLDFWLILAKCKSGPLEWVLTGQVPIIRPRHIVTGIEAPVNESTGVTVVPRHVIDTHAPQAEEVEALRHRIKELEEQQQVLQGQVSACQGKVEAYREIITQLTPKPYPPA